jgi:hypothetical protein
LMRVCKASHAGGKEHLRTLPGLVVCGGLTLEDEDVSDAALRLDLATMRWVPMPALVTARYSHACCAVRGNLVVLGGETLAALISSVERLPSSEEGGAFVDLPSLSCGGIYGAAAIAVEESDSAAGQVLLLGGSHGSGAVSTVQLVDLATGACAPQDNLLHPRVYSAAERLPDGRVVCSGGFGSMGAQSSAEVWGPPEQGAPDAAWGWRELPAMSVGRYGCRGCVMSDGRFAVLGGMSNGLPTSSCEALVFDDGDAHWALCRPCTTCGPTSHVGLSPGAPSSPVGTVGTDVNQLSCTTRSSIGGCGFRAICLTEIGSLGWAARFCRTISGTCSHVNLSLTRGFAHVHSSHHELHVFARTST